MSSSELIMQGHFTRVSWHNTAHFDVKKIIIFCYFTFHSFSPFYKQRETKNIPIQFQKGNKKIPEKYSSYWIFISFFLKKKNIHFLLLSSQLFLSQAKKLEISISNSVSSSSSSLSSLFPPADLSERGKEGEGGGTC